MRVKWAAGWAHDWWDMHVCEEHADVSGESLRQAHPWLLSLYSGYLARVSHATLRVCTRTLDCECGRREMGDDRRRDKRGHGGTHFLPRSAFCNSISSARMVMPAKGPSLKVTGRPMFSLVKSSERLCEGVSAQTRMRRGGECSLER